MNCCNYEIPETFECARHKIKVKIVELSDKNDYGYWDDVKLEIILATNVKNADGDLIPLTEMQILNSWFHELFHVWQFFYDNDMPENEAQSFANLMCEYAITSKA